jgi:hypothetical protein
MGNSTTIYNSCSSCAVTAEVAERGTTGAGPSNEVVDVIDMTGNCLEAKCVQQHSGHPSVSTCGLQVILMWSLIPLLPSNVPAISTQARLTLHPTTSTLLTQMMVPVSLLAKSSCQVRKY